MRGNRCLPLVCTCASLGLWALAASHGYAWQMIWLPAAVAGAAWTHPPTRPNCLRRLRRQRRHRDQSG